MRYSTRGDEDVADICNGRHDPWRLCNRCFRGKWFWSGSWLLFRLAHGSIQVSWSQYRHTPTSHVGRRQRIGGAALAHRRISEGPRSQENNETERMTYLYVFTICVAFGLVAGIFLWPRYRTVWAQLIMKGIFAGVSFSVAIWLSGSQRILLLIPEGVAFAAGLVYLVYIFLSVRFHNVAFADHRGERDRKSVV